MDGIIHSKIPTVAIKVYAESSRGDGFHSLGEEFWVRDLGEVADDAPSRRGKKRHEYNISVITGESTQQQATSVREAIRLAAAAALSDTKYAETPFSVEMRRRLSPNYTPDRGIPRRRLRRSR
jgi:hypothetical protein